MRVLCRSVENWRPASYFVLGFLSFGSKKIVCSAGISGVPFKMASLCRGLLVLLLVSVFLNASCIAESEKAIVKRIRTAPQRNLENVVIDGTGKIAGFDSSEGSFQGFDDRRVGSNRVSVSTVAWLTLAMAAATGLGSVPFFFVELEPQNAGVCNGLAAGVMLAASFDLIQEGQIYGSGNWNSFPLMRYGWAMSSFYFLEHYGEVSMLDIKGADASKVILVVGIMTLHSFGEGSGVGVSFAGPKGLSQGLLVTLAIAVHNIPEGLAVSMEAVPSQVASAGTLAVAFMETLSTVLQGFSHSHSSEDTSGFLVSLLFGLGPLLGGIILVAFALAFYLQHSLLIGVASGIAFLLAIWRPLQLLMSSKIGFLSLSFFLAAGSAFYHMATACILRLFRRRKASVNDIAFSSGLSISAITLQSFFACGAISLHALAEGLALGVAAPKAYGLGRHMVLPVSLHGLPRGAAVASCIFGATDSWRGALAASALTGLAGPASAIGAILAGIDYNGLDYWMVFACGALVPSFGRILLRALRLEARKSTYGFLMGLGFASLCLMSTRLVCLHTPYCNSAPEAVT
ncbi:hypothetical protein B296_00013263 [Ensete ventricosum]|uniref:Zinc transporter n=1 Tax=Ensete ventricosum TaxID=4639 RepID=A0A427ARE0_ENSVE|nr:hypothetical protein B296_00013263 [Ensete ventricosum]